MNFGNGDLKIIKNAEAEVMIKPILFKPNSKGTPSFAGTANNKLHKAGWPS